MIVPTFSHQKNMARGGGLGEWGQEQGFLKCKTFWLLLAAVSGPAANQWLQGPPAPSARAPSDAGIQRGPGRSSLQPVGNRIWEEGRHGGVKHCLSEGQSYLK